MSHTLKKSDMKCLITPIIILLISLNAQASSLFQFSWEARNDQSNSYLNGGCTDMSACNYDPSASFNDGSCCYNNCIQIEISDCDFPGEVAYSLKDDNGTEIFGLYSDAAPSSNIVCLSDGCYVIELYDAYGDGWDDGTFTVTYLNTSTVIESGIFPNNPAFEAYQRDVHFLLGPGQLGCNDPLACNYDSNATCNDGSCDYTTCIGCTNVLACNYKAEATIDDASCCTENCLTLELVDYVGDGWDDGTYEIRDEAMTLVMSGTLGYPLSYELQSLCLPDGCYYFSVQGSGYPEEVEWTINGTDTGNISGDGISFTSTYFSIGGGFCFGCTDPDACTYNPFAFIDDGSCIDGPCVAYDNPWTARPITLGAFPLNANTAGTLVGATSTQITQSADLTGEDIWFRFTAPTNGATFQVTTSAFDAIIELVDASYHSVTSVNLVSGIGGERFNTDDLTAGEVYYIGVRNYNSALGTGSFTINSQFLRRSGCPTNLGPYAVCSVLKAPHAGTSNYNFIFTNNATSEVNNYQSFGSTNIPLESVQGIEYGGSYNLEIEAIFLLPNSLGQEEMLTVPPLAGCTLTIGNPPAVSVNSNFSCSSYGAVPRNVWISFNPRVCTAIGYEIQFTNQNGIQAPFTLQSMTASRFFRFAQVPQAQNGAFYDVRIRPIFTYDYSGPWGPAVCVRVAGTSSFFTITNNLMDEPAVSREEITTEISYTASVYPNPANGSDMNLLVNSDEQTMLHVSMFDMMGKLVYTNQVQVDAELNTPMLVDKQLAAGVYTIVFESKGEHTTQRLIIENR